MSIFNSQSELPEENNTNTQVTVIKKPLRRSQLNVDAPLRMVETAFLASTSSLLWFINFYFPFGPVLRIFFPIPIALVYLRWGRRAAIMSALTTGLLLSVLTGPVRSLLFMIPFALMGVLLGETWYRRSPWLVSITLSSLLGTVGVFFRLWFLSLLSGEDLWIYLINQVTEITEWVFLKLQILAVPDVLIVNLGAIALIFFNNLLYLFVVHLAAWLLFDRLGNPIPRPPQWVQTIMNYD